MIEANKKTPKNIRNNKNLNIKKDLDYIRTPDDGYRNLNIKRNGAFLNSNISNP